MGNSSSNRARGTRVEQRQQKNETLAIRNDVSQARKQQLREISGRNPSTNVVSGNEIASSSSSPASLLSTVSATAEKLIDRGGDQFIKDDLFALILLIDPAKYLEVNKSSKNYTCEELRFIIREMMTDPERIKNSIYHKYNISHSTTENSSGNSQNLIMS